METKADMRNAFYNKTKKVDSEMNVYMILKRFFGIAFAIFALVVTSPIMAVISVAIFITDGGPVIFKQDRVGKDGKLFRIIKFRSMCKNADEILQTDPELYTKYKENNYKLPEGEDPRITPIGAFLRKTSLDELPQFLNVLKGDMSVVGPRPIVKKELKEYGVYKNLFLSMKPGVTGVWQVSGRSTIGYPDRIYLELSYLEKRSLLYDVKVVCQTVVVAMKRFGAH